MEIQLLVFELNSKIIVDPVTDFPSFFESSCFKLQENVYFKLLGFKDMVKIEVEGNWQVNF